MGRECRCQKAGEKVLHREMIRVRGDGEGGAD